MRQVGVLLIWLMFPLQLWQLRWTWRQLERWHRAEVERQDRWREAMQAADKLREEALNLRVQAEIALAQARRPLLPEVRMPGDD